MHGNRPEEAAGNPLESAAYDLRRILEADGDDSTRSPSEQRSAQAKIFRAWVAESGLILDPAEYLDHAQPGGQEHMILRDAESERIVKLTHAGRFGLAADAQWFFDGEREEAGAKAYLRDATPLEYLDRLILQNTVFGDDLRLLGIIDKARGMHVVTSQPTIRGEVVTLEEICAFMAAAGFARIDAVRLGHEDALAFFREADGLAVFDCHVGNFIKSGPHVVPIDLIIQRAAPVLLAALGC